MLTPSPSQVFGGRAITRTGMGANVERFARAVKYTAIYGGRYGKLEFFDLGFEFHGSHLFFFTFISSHDLFLSLSPSPSRSRSEEIMQSLAAKQMLKRMPPNSRL